MIPQNRKRISGRRLFQLFGVDWLAVPNVWLLVPIYAVLGLLIGMVTEFGRPLGTVLLNGLLYGLLLYVVNVFHMAGHVLVGALVGAPVDAVLLTTAWHRTLYGELQQNYPRWARVYRSLGGPMFNLVLGVVMLGWWLLFSYVWMGVLAWSNLVVGAASLLPLPWFDGGRIWGLIFGLRR